MLFKILGANGQHRVFIGELAFVLDAGLFFLVEADPFEGWDREDVDAAV